MVEIVSTLYTEHIFVKSFQDLEYTDLHCNSLNKSSTGPAGIEVRLRLFPISEWPPDECLILIRALLELLSDDEAGRWDIILILENPDTLAITESDQNQGNVDTGENSAVIVSIDNNNLELIENSNENAADAGATAGATIEVGARAEQDDNNLGDENDPSSGQLRRSLSEEDEDNTKKKSYEELWDFESDNTESSSVEYSDEDPMPGPSSKWTQTDNESSVSYTSTSAEDSEEDPLPRSHWKRTRKADEEPVQYLSDNSRDSNDSGGEPLPGPSRKRRRDGTEME